MGGYGSTRWGWDTKKQTVEHSIKLSITHLVGKVIPSEVMQNRLDWNGHYPITRDGRLTYSITSGIRWPDTGLPFVILDYWTHKQQRQISVDLTTTDCYLGSVRYWFVCPNCEQRVGCLYLPHQGDLFACRKCHDLTYKSAQTAHEGESGDYLGLISRNVNQIVRLQKLERRLIGLHYGSLKYIRMVYKMNEINKSITQMDWQLGRAREKHEQRLIRMIKRTGL